MLPRLLLVASFASLFLSMGAPQVRAVAHCDFRCAAPDGSILSPPDVGLSNVTCTSDADCVARCDATCPEVSTRNVCARGDLYASAPQPTCVDDPIQASVTAGEAPAALPPTRTPGEFGYVNPLGTISLNEVIKRVIRTALGFVGALFLAMFVYGGTVWMLAGGDDKKVESGRKAILNAVIGIVIVAISYSILGIVFETASIVRGG